jgi:hypothetical protein
MLGVQMSKVCDLTVPQEIKKMEDLEQYTDDVFKALTMSLANGPKIRNLDTDRALRAAADVIANVTGHTGEVTELNRESIEHAIERMTGERKRIFYDMLDKYAEQAYLYMNDPIEAMTVFEESERIYKVFEKAKRMEKLDVLPESIWGRVTSMFGIDLTRGSKFDIFGVKTDAIRMYAPANEAFYIKETNKEFGNSRSRDILNRARELLPKAAGAIEKKYPGLADVETVNKLTVFFDGTWNKQIVRDQVEEEAFIAFAGKPGIDLHIESEEQAADIMHIMKTTFVEPFRRINGEDVYDADNKFDPHATLEQAPQGSYLAFIRETRDKVAHMLERIETVEETAHRLGYTKEIDMLKALNSKLQNFVPREGYIPYVNSEGMGAYILQGSEDIMGSTFGARNFGYKQAYSGDDDLTNGNFMDALTDNVMGTVLFLNEYSNFFYYSYINSAVQETDDWFSNSARETIKTQVLQSAHIAERAAHKTKTLKAARDIFSISSIMPTWILSYPGSAFKNVLAGNLNIYWRLGKEMGMTDYRSSLKNESDPYHDFAANIEALTDQELLSVGMVGEWVDKNKEYESTKEKLTDRVMNAVHKSNDFVSEGMGLGYVFESWHRVMTMGGSEDNMRKTIAGVIFNRVQDQAELRGLEGDALNAFLNDKDAIKDIVRDSFHDMAGALGNFSSENRPFAMHAMYENADTATELLLGLGLKWAYTFRHAGFVTMKNFTHAFGDEAYKIGMGLKNPYESEKGVSDKVRDAGKLAALAFGIGLSIYEIVKRTYFSETEEFPKINMGIETALNPYEELDIMPKWVAFLTMKAFNNTPMSDEDYQILKNETLQFVAGLHTTSNPRLMLMADKSIQELEATNLMMFNIPKAFMSFIDTPTTTQRVGYEAIRDLQQMGYEHSRSLGTFLALDPIHMAQKLYTMTMFSAPNDPAATWKFRADTAVSTIVSTLGLHIWSERELKRPEYKYKQPYQHEYQTNQAYRYTSALPRLGRMYGQGFAADASRAVKNYVNYGGALKRHKGR